MKKSAPTQPSNRTRHKKKTSTPGIPKLPASPGRPRNLLRELSSAVEQTADSLMICSPEGVIQYVNSAFEKLTGFPREEAVGSTPKILRSGLHPKSFYDNMWNTILAGQPFRGSFINKKKTGELYYEEKNITPVTNEHGQITAFVSTGRDMTERVGVEDSLRRSEERFRLLVEGVRDYAIYMLDSAGHVLNWNAGAVRNTGYREGDILGKHFSVLYPREDVEQGKPVRLLDAATRHDRTETDCWHVRKDGTKFWASVTLTALRDKNGALRGFSKITRDATAQKEAEERLRASMQLAEREKEKFQSLLESAPDPILGVDAEGHITLANAQTEAVFGYTREELLGQTVDSLLPEALREAHARHRDGYAAHPNTRLMGAGLDLVARRKDGSTFPVEISLSPLNTEEGLLITSIIRDITARKQVEEALQRSEENFRSLVERAPYGIYRSTTDGRILMANRALVKMLGYESEAELLTVNLATHIYRDPADRKRLVEEIQGSDQYQGLEVDWQRKDGTPITVRLSGSRIQDQAAGSGYFESVAEDVTGQRLLESQFRQSQKMHAVGRLAGGIAHDFNNVLTLIFGYSELLLNTLSHDEPARQTAEEIRKAATHASELTQQLLAFSRKQKIQPKVINLNGAVEQMERILRRALGEDIELSIHLDRDLGQVKAEPSQIEQVLLNLAVNARDAMPKGGRLTIRTANTVLDDSASSQRPGLPPGPYVLLAVEDSGAGMDEETQAQIFDPFFTTKEKGKGTGLGLATVYGIISQHGGQIAVLSQPGHGTTFQIYLPRTEQAVAREESKPVTPSDGPEAGTVLLVEDEASLRSLAREFLVMNGFQVLDADNGDEAIRVAKSHPDPIQVLVTDMVMPGMGGSELAERLQAMEPAVKVLYISGYAQDEIQTEPAPGRETAFLQKPFPLDALVQKVRDLLAR